MKKMIMTMKRKRRKTCNSYEDAAAFSGNYDSDLNYGCLKRSLKLFLGKISHF